MAKVKMLLDLDFNKLQDIKAKILSLALRIDLGSDLCTEEREAIDYTVKLIDMIQDQAIDNTGNNYTVKQVYGSQLYGPVTHWIEFRTHNSADRVRFPAGPLNKLACHANKYIRKEIKNESNTRAV